MHTVLMLFLSRLLEGHGDFYYKYTRATCVIGPDVISSFLLFVADRRLASEGCARMPVRDCERSSSSDEKARVRRRVPTS